MRSSNGLVLLLTLSLIGCAAEDQVTVSAERQRVSTDNGLSFNGLSFNGLSFNGLSFNGLSFNGLSFNGAVMAALEDATLVPDGSMTKGEARREALAYIYKCAMPAGASMDLEIDGTVYTFNGELGLAPEWGASDDAVCDTTCQRWVSACLMAHTNYFGESVQISVRGPHAALAGVSGAESSAFDIQEGAFFGNLFLDADSSEYIGGFACDGTGLNYSEVTRRRCAEEPGCSISLTDPCSGGEIPGILGPVTVPPSCNTALNADGAYTSCGLFDGEIVWNEVITVYLSNPYFCGDGICQEGEETHETCALDCAAPAACGDGVCQAETCTWVMGTLYCAAADEEVESCGSCSADCGACPTCGDGVCSQWEDCDSCPSDCPSGLLACVGGYCGDGVCQGDETCGSCPGDCNTCAGVCGNGLCEAGENSSNCIEDCVVRCGDGVCHGPAEDASSCAEDCPPVCGDGVCNGSEDCSSCSSDCGACAPACGNHVCEVGEDCSSCSADCGSCPLPEPKTTSDSKYCDGSCTFKDYFYCPSDCSGGSTTIKVSTCTSLICSRY